MPQPVRFKCHATISGLVHRPEHAKILGHIVGISGRLESSLGWLLAFLSRGSAIVAIPMFHAVQSTGAQRDMLLAAADNALAGPELGAFRDLMLDFRPRYKERSRLIHNLWGHSNDHPDKAFWWKASDMGIIMGSIAANPLSFNLEEENLSLKAMMYTVKDLQDAAARLDEYRERTSTFLRSLFDNHPAIAAATSASTNAPPIGAEPQLNLNHPQTAP